MCHIIDYIVDVDADVSFTVLMHTLHVSAGETAVHTHGEAETCAQV